MGILLIADEVQAGYGRPGPFLEPWSHFGVPSGCAVPRDGQGSGQVAFPWSAIGASAELMAKGMPGSQGGYLRRQIAVAAPPATATLDVIERSQNWLENAAAARRTRCSGQLHRLQRDLSLDCRDSRQGLMLGMESAESPDRASAQVALRT